MATDDDDAPKGPKNPPHNAAAPQADLRRLEEARRLQTAPTPPSAGAYPVGGVVSVGAPASSPPRDYLSPTSTGEHPVTNREMNRAFNLNDIRVVAAMLVVAVGTCFTAYKFVIGDARAQTDAGVQVVATQLDNYRKSTDASISELKQEMKKMATKEEVKEVQQDIREFYRVWRDDRRSVRLEQPVGFDAGR